MVYMNSGTIAAAQAMAQQKARKRAIKEAKRGLKHLQKAQAMGLDIKLCISPDDAQKLASLIGQ